jgi:hypothetical protein
MLYGKLDQLGCILHTDFIHDVVAMYFHVRTLIPSRVAMR